MHATTISQRLRQGAVLVTALIIVMMVATMIMLSSDRLMGVRRIFSANLARQQATYAAEAVAALLEAKLMGASGDFQKLNTNIAAQSPVWVANNAGYADPAAPTNNTGIWIGKCLVRWRIEPVTVWNTVVTDTNGDGRITDADLPAGSTYALNYQPNGNVAAPPAKPGCTMFTSNPGYYHFRVTSEAYFLNDRDPQGHALPNPPTPWNTPGQSACTVQAQRVVQINISSLFKYVIFYAARAPTGDIEFHPGGSLSILGPVHSNGAIYPSGQGNAFTTGDYHNSASRGQNVSIGTAAQPTAVEGYAGIFRQRKAGNIRYAATHGVNATTALNGMNTPLPGLLYGTATMSGLNDLNGDDQAGDSPGVVTFNGTPFTYDKDSRSVAAFGTMGTYVRDSGHNAPFVNTFANIPQLAGYPLEYQKCVGPGVQISQKGAGGAWGAASWTINPWLYPNPVPGWYTNVAGGNYTIVWTTTPLATYTPVYAADLPLFTFAHPTAAGATVQDIWPNAGPPPLDANTGLASTNSAIRTVEVGTVGPTDLSDIDNTDFTNGYYLHQALYGPQGSNTVGITIRERGQQNTTNVAYKWQDAGMGWNWPPNARPTPAMIPGTYPNFGIYANAYVSWLESQFVVYFGNDTTGNLVDITTQFFSYNLAGAKAANDITDLNANHDLFMNCREADWLQTSGYVTAAQAPNCKMDVITLNIANIQNFLKTQILGAFPPLTGTALANTIFSGLIYVHRTPRLRDPGAPPYVNNPAMPLAYHPCTLNAAGQVSPVPAALTSTTAPYNVYNYASLALGRYPVVNNFAANQQIGNANTWVMYPSAKAVRVAQADNIDWGGRLNYINLSGVSTWRTAGLTVATPNGGYLWGNINITRKADGVGDLQVPPCAVYADSMTALSSSWTDAGETYPGTRQTACNVLQHGRITGMTAANPPQPIFTTAPTVPITSYWLSMVINNVPSDSENASTYASQEGSGGTHNVVRFLENWNNLAPRQVWEFLGSLVILNRARYTRGYVNGVNVGCYSPPNRQMFFNFDLLTAAGRPPAAPWGTSATRVLSMVNFVNK